MILTRSTGLLFAILLLLTGALAACAETDDDENDEPDASEILDNATERFMETESARFDLEIEGSIGIDEEGMLELGAVEGEIARPASARADASVQFAGSSVSMEMVAVDGEMYLRNILTGEWERAPSDLQYDPARIFDEEEGISWIIEELEDLQVAGEESINGVDAWHLTASIDTETVEGLTGEFFESETLDVDIWVATDDYRLLRVELHDAEAAEAATWQLNLRDHDEPVDITAPDLD